MNFGSDKQTTLRDIIYTLFKHKIIILVCFISVVISVNQLTGKKQDIYKASTSLLVKTGRENLYRFSTPQGTSTVMDGSSKVERMNNELAILRGRDLIKLVIEDIGIENIYPWLLIKKTPENNNAPTIPPIETAIGIFGFNLGLKAIDKSNIIQISFTHFNPHIAAKAANTVVDHFLIQHLKIYLQPEQLNFFEGQVEKYKEILEESENKLKAFKKKHNISEILSQKNDLLNKISRFKSDIADTSVNISELEAKLILLKEKEASGETSQMNLDAITNIRNKVTTLKLDEQQLLSKYNPNNIKIVNIRSEIKAAEELIKAEEMTYFQKEKISIQNDLDALNSKLNAQDEYLTIYQNELGVLDTIELKLKDLTRNVELNEQSYILYTSRREEARISNEMDSQKMANLSVVDKASPPIMPMKTSGALNTLLSMILGLLFGIVVAIVVEFNCHSFNNPDDIDKHLQIKVLASVPELKNKSPLNKLFNRSNL